MKSEKELLKLGTTDGWKIISFNEKLSEIDSAKDVEQRSRTFNGMTAREWTTHSRSVWNDVSSQRTSKHLNHGATYPEKLCTRLIEMYSKESDVVLDPFLGTGTTVIAALNKKRKAIGIELTDRFFEVANKEINNLYSKNQKTLDGTMFSDYTLLQGDCCEVLKTIEDDSVQLTITSPPYADLIHKVVEDRTLRHKKSAFVEDNNATTNLYSSDDRDLGNMTMNNYLDHVNIVMSELYRCTKAGGYNVWVVKDYRDTKNKIPYVDLHTKISQCGEKAGFKYHDLIIWDQNEQRKLVLLGYPSVFYVNQNNSFLVVLRI